MKQIDYWCMGLITLLFSILVLYKIGDTQAPESFYYATQENRDIVLDFGENRSINHIVIYLGPMDNRTFAISSYNENDSMWQLLSNDQIAGSVFAWNQLSVLHEIRHLGVVSMDEEAILGELIIVAGDGSVILPVNAADYPELFDEQVTFPTTRTYYNNTIFDEIYHGRTAYEFIHGLTSYETTHPPLGKTLISLGIRLFGMTPFGWRFITAIFGILMVPLFYLFGKVLFQDTLITAAVTTLLSVDCMHYALSRISTIDIIIAFFIVLMYLLLFVFFLTDLGKLPGDPRVSLALCGITMGMAIATKWTGVYAGAGLGLMFFWYLIDQRPPWKKVRSLGGFCLIFFCLLPVVIYFLSYVPFVEYEPSANLIMKTINNSKSMFSYHSGLEAEHYYSTPFYEWPFMRMPLLYATDKAGDTTVSSLSCMGNPVIWWCGIPCLLFSMYRWLVKNDNKAGFLVIAYLAQYIPWFFVDRITFIYHYFPSSLFLILIIGHVLDLLARRWSWAKYVVYGFVGAAVIVFILFFPVISGLPTGKEYQISLRWLKEWILVL